MSDPITQALDEMQARCDAATFDGGWLDLYGPPSQLRAIYAVTECDMPRLIAAIKAVLELHLPVPYAQGPDYCDECEHPAPCQTVKAIAKALGVES